MAPDEHLDRVRAVLRNRYQVEREIGRGGAARVYLADPVEGGDPVAIKVLRDELAAAVARDRFRLEIAVTTTLHHPNILPIIASDEVEGLLYYVAPFVRGETLRQRLIRERELSLAEAIRIAGAIAAGLTAAHAQGFVHRDIKPENILLDGDRVLVADFGIVRAITAATGDRLTSTGVAIGTPGYMSPEQATGESLIDHRSDIYALGCVLYEMLAGETPFTGPSAQAIVAKQIGLPTPSLRTVRGAVPPSLDRIIRRALEKVPADRFASVAEFTAALAALEAGPTWGDRVRWAASGPAAWLGAAVAAAVVVWMLLTRPGFPSRAISADTTRYLVVPGRPASATMRDALLRWSGVSAVDPAGVAEALRGDTGVLSPARAATLARRFGAGRILVETASPAGDSTRMNVSLYDAVAGEGTLLSERAFYVAKADRRQDSLLTAAVDHVLFRGVPPGDAPDTNTTRSLPARQGFADGRRALARWDLAGADSAFARTEREDPDYAQAALWLAVTRAWSGAPVAGWRVPVQQAVLRKDRLSPVDLRIALAIAAEGDSDWATACPDWRKGAHQDDKSFEVWYGLARCLASDNVVVPDPRSPSGWRFRTGYDEALRAYRKAFERDPAILASFRPRSFAWLRFLFKTGGNQLRSGPGLPPDTRTFAADPELRGKIVDFIPSPQTASRPHPVSSDAAVHQLRLQFRAVAADWVTADPKSAPAHEALAVAMAMLGDPTALDTLRRASALAVDKGDRFRLVISEIWMRLGLSLPAADSGLRRVRELADSLLNAPPDSTADLSSLQSLASLTGRASQAAAYAVAQRRREAPDEPADLRDAGPALLIYSAIGGPAESLSALEPRVRRGVGALASAERRAAQDNWLVLPASLAYPNHRFASLPELAAEDPIVQLEFAAVRGDTAGVRVGLRQRRRIADTVTPAALTFDALLPEAILALWLGTPRDAAAWLDPPLGALGTKAPDVLASPAGVACLVRTMALRAEIADRLHDRDGARRWARAVVALWSGADTFLQPMVDRQRQLTR